MTERIIRKGEAAVYVRQGQVFVTTEARINSGEYEGMHTTVEPIYTMALDISDLSHALQQVLGAGLVTIPSPSRDEMMHPDNKKDPLLRAAKVGSWRKLYQDCSVYGVTLYDDGVELTFWKPLEKGRGFVPDMSKTRRYSPSTDMKEITKAILDDVRSRPELSAPLEAPKKPQ